MKNKTDLVIYQNKSGNIELRTDFEKDALWANQSQIVQLFEVDQSVVSRHIRNIFKDGELDIKSNMQKMHIANSDKPVVFYSLDILLAVGYRTNSKVAVAFRRWSTKILHQHIVEGYTLNKKRLVNNYHNFLQAVDNIKMLLPTGSKITSENTLELIKMFASTWFTLNAYDKKELPKTGNKYADVKLTTELLLGSLQDLKRELIAKNEAGDLFGREKDKGGVDAIVGAVFQSFDSVDVYPTVEEKAAHLIYFFVKNHPFVDGNKRSGAFSFVWFLNKVKLFDFSKISAEALTTLTILIAESEPGKKDLMISLVLQLLGGKYE